MTLDPRFVVGININDYFVDKTTGLPLEGGTIEFFKDQDRSAGKLVYQLTGSPPNYTYTPLSNPLTLSTVGTVVNNSSPAKNVAIYYYPYDELGNVELYYIVVKDSGGTTQLVREAWPNITAEDDPTQTENSVTNQLQNPQFVDVFFNPDYGVTISTGGAVSDAVYDIAPNWFLRVSANADSNIVVNRVGISGAENVVTNPPFQLEIEPQSNNITSIELVQRLYHNPDLWANGFVAGSAVVASLDGIAHTVEMLYSPNIAAAATTVFSGATETTGYSRLEGTIEIEAGTNTDTGDDGYLDIVYVLPPIGSVAITSTQIVGLASNATNIDYEQQPVNMQESLLFSHYNPLIQQVPVPSLLQGWDFKVNPAQFGETVSMGAVDSQYLWDQLIGWQSVDSSVSISRNPAGNLNVNLSTTGQFALIQYLSATQLKEFLANDFSVLMEGYSDQVAGASGTVSFWYTTDATLPNVASGTNLSLISTVDANGVPLTFNGNWTQLTRNYRGDGRFTLPYSSSSAPQSISLEGWNNPGYTIASTATYAAIVVGFASAPASNVVFKSISVTPGLLARPFAPLSYELTRKELEYYYEKSYDPGVYAGAATSIGQLSKPQVVTTASVTGGLVANEWKYYTGNFGIEFRSMKRAVPTVHLYSTISGAIDTVIYRIASTSNTGESVSRWSVASGRYAVNYEPLDSTPIDTLSSPKAPTLYFQYTADARLGIVL
jgi:hypothetical protein